MQPSCASGFACQQLSGIMSDFDGPAPNTVSSLSGISLALRERKSEDPSAKMTDEDDWRTRLAKDWRILARPGRIEYSGAQSTIL
jgi:hypothetical protein